MNEVPERGQLTDQMLAYLSGHTGVTGFPLLVGDNDPPFEAGWTGAQPGVGDFTASVTVRTGNAVSLHRDTVRSRHSSWRCRYGIRTVGAVRSQADAAADVARAALVAFRDVAVAGPSGWHLQDAVYESFGGVEKRGTGDNATFEVDDTIDLWVVRAAT